MSTSFLMKLAVACAAMVCAAVRAADAPANAKPNVVFILADDLGYGDVRCLNPQRGKIPTPNIDRLASQGMLFTDAHSSSAVCSPTRYGVLTGRYNWRSTLQAGIVNVFGKPLIAPDRLTVAKLMKQNGYHTACIGKWHLGWDWPAEVTAARSGKGAAAGLVTEARLAAWREGFAKPISGGPTARGFDYYFGTDVPNWPPYCFIENDRTIGIPSEPLPGSLVGKNQASLHGPALPGWKLEAILPALIDKACGHIAQRGAAGGPFFLYLPLTSPHTPLAVNEAWKGKSGLGAYADLVMETDAMVGRVLEALDKAGVADNTLVIFTSDNGCAHYIGVPAMEAAGHYPSAHLRGYKSDAWDGGHRVPFIARWPGVVKPGSTCGQLVCLTDLMATCAAVLGTKLPEGAGEDSVSILPLLKGEDRAVREAVVHHSISGRFAIRQGKWKLIFDGGSGGWSQPNAEAGLPPVQLYDMERDAGEKANVQDQHPEVVKALTALLEKYVADGRSTPGTAQKNDAEVRIRKAGPASRPAGKAAAKQSRKGTR